MRKRADIQPQRSTKSSLHRAVVAAVRSAFPTMSVKEEATIEGPCGKLYVDILIRELDVCIECHGRQHYEFVKHFHGTRDGFERSRQRDAVKAEAIANAGHTLVVVPYWEESKINPKRIAQMVVKAIKEQSR